LFSMLTQIYKQDVLDIANDIKLAKNAPCICGSKNKYKRCCMVKH